MAVNVANNTEFRNYSEIEFLLGSDLLDFSWGIKKLIHRLPLFTAHKRHIPHLLLIHLALYNRDFPEKEKREIINLLLDSLYQDLVKKSTKNQLVNFVPKYYLVRLLFDLYNSGYKIDRIIKGLKDEYLPVMQILTYGNAAKDEFPQALIRFRKKLTAPKYFSESYYRYKDQAEIAAAAIKAYNVKAYDEILPLIADKHLKNSLIQTAVHVFTEHKEIEKAIKLVDHDLSKDSRSGSYLDIALTLSRIGKIDTLNELNKSVADPEISISILCGILDFYSVQNAPGIVAKLLSEAIVVLKTIQNSLLRSWRSCFLLIIAHRLGDNALIESLIEDILIYDSWINEKDSKENYILRSYFFSVLVSIGRREMAMEYIKKWESVTGDIDEELLKFHNINVKIQIIVEKELNSIDNKIRLDRLSNTTDVGGHTDYYRSVLQLAEMIPGDTYKEESLCVIAKRMAEQGLYENALRLKAMITHESWQNDIDFAVCLSAVKHGDVNAAMGFAGTIADENTKFSVQLCMASRLSELGYRREAELLVRQWGSFIFNIS